MLSKRCANIYIALLLGGDDGGGGAKSAECASSLKVYPGAVGLSSEFKRRSHKLERASREKSAEIRATVEGQSRRNRLFGSDKGDYYLVAQIDRLSRPARSG